MVSHVAKSHSSRFDCTYKTSSSEFKFGFAADNEMAHAEWSVLRGRSSLVVSLSFYWLLVSLNFKFYRIVLKLDRFFSPSVGSRKENADVGIPES